MEKREDFYIPEEIADFVGLKKSEYLSKLIEKLGPGDIGFEEFHLYDTYITGTIESPDKAFESNDDQYMMRTYIRSYSEKKGFHQVVIGVVMDDKASKSNVFIPVISFVSRNVEIVKEFCVGDVITRPTLN